MARRGETRSTPTTTPAAPRRIPQQERSRARVENILRTARRLIGEKGNVSMREIAQAAGVPIASLYQYYPDQTALLRALAVEFYDRIRERLSLALTLVEKAEDVPTFIDAMIDGLLAELGRRESHLNVWAACQSHPILRELDMGDALELAALMSARFEAINPGNDPGAIRDICVFAVVMAGPAARQAFVMPKGDGERLIRELKTLIRLRAEALLGGAKGPVRAHAGSTSVR